MPEMSHNELNSCNVNSLPLTVLKVSILVHVSCSTTHLSFLNLSKALLFSFKKIVHMYLE